MVKGANLLGIATAPLLGGAVSLRIQCSMMTTRRRLFVCWLMALTASVCLHDRGAMRAVQLQPSGGPTESIATVRRLIEAGRYDEAEKAGLSLVATLDAGRSGVTLEIAAALDLVLDARRLGRRMTNPGTVELAERAFKIKEAALPPDEPTLATTLVLLGHARAAHRNVDTGRVAVDRAMALRERALGPDHLDIAATWNARAWVERYGGNYPDAAAAAERALAIARRLEQPAGREAAAALEMLAFAARSMGEADRAVSLAEEMLAIEERMRGPDHPALVNALLALASAVLDAGDLDQARLVHERAFRLLEATPGSEYRTAFELLLYASKVNGLGEHAQALSAAERAVAVAEKATGPASTLSAAALERLATTYADLGDHGAAARIRQRTVALWEATQGPDGLHVGAALTALAQSYEQGGQIDAAFDIIERAITILSIGKQPIMYHEALSTKGRLLMGRGRLEQARAVLEQARQVSANGNMGAVRYNHAATLTLLARLERQAGHPARAVPLYRDAIRRVEQEYGVAHPTIADWRTDLAVTLAATGAFDEARRLLVGSETASLAHLRLVSRTLTERAALAFASSRVSGADLAVTLAADPAVRIRRDIDVAWDLIIQGRTIVLDEMAARQRAVVADRALRDQWAVLNRARTRLANLIVRGPDGQPADRYQALVERSRTQRDRAERELAEASVAFREEQSRARAGLREVVARLPPRAALVAYVRYTAACLAAVDRDSRESPPPARSCRGVPGPHGPCGARLRRVRRAPGTTGACRAARAC